MKSKLLVIPLLLLCSCTSGQKKYTNVFYYFDRDELCYQVELDENKKVKMQPKDVHYVDQNEYLFTEKHDIITNELYVKGYQYSLFVYKYSK